jgi:hypothetical protein
VHWVWAAAAMVGLWANMHGGFTLALGMLALWTLCQCAAAWRTGGLTALRRLWPLPAATLAAFALAGLANPFGLRNLTEFLVVGHSSVWRMVVDWQSIWHAGWRGLGKYWEFLALIVLTAGLSAAHAWSWRRSRAALGRAADARAGDDRAAVAIFEIVLLAVVVYMGCAAQRFTPVAMILLTPLLALRLEWLLRPSRQFLPLAAACLLAVAASVYLVGRLARHYSPMNPAAEPETFFQRMIVEAEVDPARLAEFINANGIEGRIFQEWPWEGYLRVKCPRLSLWVGARAQQVYPEEEYRQEWAVVHYPAQYAGTLGQRDIHLIAVSRNRAQDLLPALALGPQARWAVIYFDGSSLLLADGGNAISAALIEDALAGRLQWPSANIAVLSQALCMTSTPNRHRFDGAIRRALLHEAIGLGANPLQTQLLVSLSTRRDGTLEETDAQFLTGQYNRWSELSQPAPRGWMVVDMCGEIASALAAHHQAAGRLAEARDWAGKARRMEQLGEQIKQRWLVRGPA